MTTSFPLSAFPCDEHGRVGGPSTFNRFPDALDLIAVANEKGEKTRPDPRPGFALQDSPAHRAALSLSREAP